MEFNGKVFAVGQIQSGQSARGEWQKQEFVVETEEQYPKKSVFTLFGADKINAAVLQVGDRVRVSFDINAHEYNGRWYNQINAWKVENANAVPVPPPTTDINTVAAPPAQQGDMFAPQGQQSDLPF